MNETVGIHDRFYEVPAPLATHERRRQDEGWAVIMDRATGHAMIFCANTRANALWVIRALNTADRTVDRLPTEDDAA